jgi:hypothetical protein
LDKLNKKHWNVANGGAWKPKDCVAQQRVAIMIPHRLVGIKGIMSNIVTFLATSYLENMQEIIKLWQRGIYEFIIDQKNNFSH